MPKILEKLFGNETAAKNLQEELEHVHAELGIAIGHIRNLEHDWREKTRIVKEFLEQWNQVWDLKILKNHILVVRKISHSEGKDLKQEEDAVLYIGHFMETVGKQQSFPIAIYTRLKTVLDRNKEILEELERNLKAQVNFIDRYSSEDIGVVRFHIKSFIKLLHEEGALLGLEERELAALIEAERFVADRLRGKGEEQLYAEFEANLKTIIDLRTALEEKAKLVKKLRDCLYLVERIPELRRELAGYEAEIASLQRKWWGLSKRPKRAHTEAFEELKQKITTTRSDLESYSQQESQKKEEISELTGQLKLDPGASLSDAEKLEEELKARIKSLDQVYGGERKGALQKSFDVYGLREAHQIFGNNFYGPFNVYDAFGVKLDKNEVPPLPERAIMERANGLGAVLALRVYGVIPKSDLFGGPLGYWNSETGSYDKPKIEYVGRKPEWKLFLPDFQPDTVNKNYFDQTRAMRDYLKKVGSLGDEEASECTDEKLAELFELGKTNPRAAVLSSIALQINQNHRHSTESIIYFNRLMREYGLYEKMKGQITLDYVPSHQHSFTQKNFETLNSDIGNASKSGYFTAVGYFTRNTRGYAHMKWNERVNNFDDVPQGVRIILK